MSTITTDIAVFLGPTLPRADAAALLDAAYLPPARRGDVYRLLGTGVRTIVLIDGVFLQTPSVWPREILAAMEEGIRVFGAGSMGALRAAELHPFGMQGFGRVFEWYRDGVITGDDEVALLHGTSEDGHRPMSEPLVNIRFNLWNAAEAGVLSVEEAHALIAHSRDRFFGERSYGHLFDAPLLRDWPPERRRALESWRDTAVNLKAEDARGVLRHVARLSLGESDHIPSASRRNRPWQLERYRAQGCFGTGEMTAAALLKRAGLPESSEAEFWSLLVRRCYLLDWSEKSGLARPRETGDTRPEPDPTFLVRNRLSIALYRRLREERELVEWMASPGESGFLEAWAEDNQIQCPSHNVAALAARRGVAPEQVEQEELLNWIVEKGPNYFGVAGWDFRVALIEELQFRGLAERLYE